MNIEDRIMSKLEDLERELSVIHVDIAKITKDFESISANTKKLEFSISSIEKTTETVVRENILIKDKIDYLMKKKDIIEQSILDIKTGYTINWVHAVGKYIPYILIIGIFTLMFTESPVHSMFVKATLSKTASR